MAAERKDPALAFGKFWDVVAARSVMMRHADELQFGFNAALCLIGICQIGKAMDRITFGDSSSPAAEVGCPFARKFDRELLGCLFMAWGMFGFSTYVAISKTSAVIRAQHGSGREDLVAEEIRRHRDRKYSDTYLFVGATTVLAVISQGMTRLLCALAG
jgi:hypothetical protein